MEGERPRPRITRNLVEAVVVVIGAREKGIEQSLCGEGEMLAIDDENDDCDAAYEKDDDDDFG